MEQVQYDVTYSNPGEAINKARQLFASEPNREWIIATGNETVGGVLDEGLRGDLVLHKSELGMYTGARSISEVKALILEKVNEDV